MNIIHTSDINNKIPINSYAYKLLILWYAIFIQLRNYCNIKWYMEQLLKKKRGKGYAIFKCNWLKINKKKRHGKCVWVKNRKLKQNYYDIMKLIIW